MLGGNTGATSCHHSRHEPCEATVKGATKSARELSRSVRHRDGPSIFMKTSSGHVDVRGARTYGHKEHQSIVKLRTLATQLSSALTSVGCTLEKKPSKAQRASTYSRGDGKAKTWELSSDSEIGECLGTLPDLQLVAALPRPNSCGSSDDDFVSVMNDMNDSSDLVLGSVSSGLGRSGRGASTPASLWRSRLQ